MEELPPPNRRGRKPGSKNKPKLRPETALPTADVERPRRGRKPGSKNRPKPETAPSSLSGPAASPSSLAAAMRSYGFVDDGTAWAPAEKAPVADRAPPPPSPAPVAAEIAEAEPAASAARSRVRLRDRSSILKRYVLDIEPRPGQPGAIRARRLARAV